MVLVLYEMQSVWSRIWTRVTVSISYDGNIFNHTFNLFINNIFRKPIIDEDMFYVFYVFKYPVPNWSPPKQ